MDCKMVVQCVILGLPLKMAYRSPWTLDRDKRKRGDPLEPPPRLNLSGQSGTD